MKFAVVKVGGSLENIASYEERITRFLQSVNASQVVVVVGGGALVNQLRVVSARENWPATKSHWAAIRAMSQSAETASRRLGLEIVRSFSTLVHAEKSVVIFDCFDWLSERQASSEFPLPESWDVTSDSIALALACDLAAEQLILLKSVDASEPIDVDRLADDGIVDAHFPIVWKRTTQPIHLQVVNFAT